MNPICTFGCGVENTCHFFLHSLTLLAERNTFLNKITDIDSNILNQANTIMTKTLSSGNSKNFNGINFLILDISINFTLTSKRFTEPLLNSQ